MEARRAKREPEVEAHWALEAVEEQEEAQKVEASAVDRRELVE